MRARRWLPGIALFLLFLPTPARAQLRAIEAFARQVTDLSFYFSTGDLLGGSDELSTGDFGLAAYGVELLFTVAEIRRPVPGAEAPPPPDDSVRWVVREMEVTRSGGQVDTVYRYDAVPVQRAGVPRETIWLMELGIGYGQLVGFRSEFDDRLDLRGAVRDLPAVSLYASYEPWGIYLGLRTGFMKTVDLQVVETDGEAFRGGAEAFLFGAVVGYALPAMGMNLFLEGGYSLRYFPSVNWTGSAELPDGVPRDLGVSGWLLSTGLQFPLK